MDSGLKYSERVVVIARKGYQRAVRKRSCGNPEEDTVLRVSNCTDESRQASQSAPHSRPSLGMNPPTGRVRLTRILDLRRSYVLLHVFERRLVESCVFLFHIGAEIDDPHWLRLSGHQHSIYPRHDYVAVRPAVGVVPRQHLASNVLGDVEVATLRVAHERDSGV